ncbi:MAG: hypothetical protein Q8L79_05565 [Methylobacter sp.]|uniref:hypothetical protein n=1 Tax=Methylobacter sp. TaxID=2051955 RepID=UPI00272F0D15|nr:hypothetical protein [Methylobacter sp.]MDP1664579.1 hypothetical protein [Methylobacter sp.]
MIISKVIRDDGRHITRADYDDSRPLLDSINVKFPRVNSLQARSLRRVLSGLMLTHMDFYFASRSYRLSSFIDELRKKGWTIVDHDEVAPTKDIVPRNAPFTRYELFAEFTTELMTRIKAFCQAVDDLESKAAK